MQPDELLTAQAMKTEEIKNLSEEKGEELREEALIPDLSEDFFEFEGRKIRIKLLTVKNQSRFNKTVKPFIEGLALNLMYKSSELANVRVDEYVSLTLKALDNLDVLCKIIQILADNDGQPITDEEIENSTMQQADMMAILARYFSKKSLIEGHIADFFLKVLPKLEAEAAAGMANINKTLLDSTLTSLLSDSAKSMAGQSNTSPSK